MLIWHHQESFKFSRITRLTWHEFGFIDHKSNSIRISVSKRASIRHVDFNWGQEYVAPVQNNIRVILYINIKLPCDPDQDKRVKGSGYTSCRIWYFSKISPVKHFSKLSWYTITLRHVINSICLSVTNTVLTAWMGCEKKRQQEQLNHQKKWPIVLRTQLSLRNYNSNNFFCPFSFTSARCKCACTCGNMRRRPMTEGAINRSRRGGWAACTEQTDFLSWESSLQGSSRPGAPGKGSAHGIFLGLPPTTHESQGCLDTLRSKIDSCDKLPPPPPPPGRKWPHPGKSPIRRPWKVRLYARNPGHHLRAQIIHVIL